jgi:hypothetical protein
MTDFCPTLFFFSDFVNEREAKYCHLKKNFVKYKDRNGKLEGDSLSFRWEIVAF